MSHQLQGNKPKDSKLQASKIYDKQSSTRLNANYKPCLFYVIIGRPGRHHSESACETRLNLENDKNSTKTVNNTEIQEELNKTVNDQKN